MSQPFNATNRPHTCLWCGRRLAAERTTTTRPLTPEERERFLLAKAEADAARAAAWAAEQAGDITWEARDRQLAAADRALDRAVAGKYPNTLRRAQGPPESVLIEESTKTGRYGLFGEDQFDTRGCAEAFGHTLARAGRRLAPRAVA